jgi:GxxExxY protein
MRPEEIENEIGTKVVHAAFLVHKELGPGLIEKVYEICLEYELTKQGLLVERQVPVDIEHRDRTFNEALRLDMLINKKVIIELKSAEGHNKVWEAQLLSYLKLSGKNLGYLINFNKPIIKEGIKRFRI